MNMDDMVNRATMIRDLPADEKPRERLRALGAGQLSNPELIAILLRTGMKGENVLSPVQMPLHFFFISRIR